MLCSGALLIPQPSWGAKGSPREQGENEEEKDGAREDQKWRAGAWKRDMGSGQETLCGWERQRQSHREGEAETERQKTETEIQRQRDRRQRHREGETEAETERHRDKEEQR